jgi:hypothetical protein
MAALKRKAVSKKDDPWLTSTLFSKICACDTYTKILAWPKERYQPVLGLEHCDTRGIFVFTSPGILKKTRTRNTQSFPMTLSSVPIYICRERVVSRLYPPCPSMDQKKQQEIASICGAEYINKCLTTQEEEASSSTTVPHENRVICIDDASPVYIRSFALGLSTSSNSILVCNPKFGNDADLASGDKKIASFIPIAKSLFAFLRDNPLNYMAIRFHFLLNYTSNLDRIFPDIVILLLRQLIPFRNGNLTLSFPFTGLLEKLQIIAQDIINLARIFNYEMQTLTIQVLANCVGFISLVTKGIADESKYSRMRVLPSHLYGTQSQDIILNMLRKYVPTCCHRVDSSDDWLSIEELKDIEKLEYHRKRTLSQHGAILPNGMKVHLLNILPTDNDSQKGHYDDIPYHYYAIGQDWEVPKKYKSDTNNRFFMVSRYNDLWFAFHILPIENNETFDKLKGLPCGTCLPIPETESIGSGNPESDTEEDVDHIRVPKPLNTSDFLDSTTILSDQSFSITPPPPDQDKEEDPIVIPLSNRKRLKRRRLDSDADSLEHTESPAVVVSSSSVDFYVYINSKEQTNVWKLTISKTYSEIIDALSLLTRDKRNFITFVGEEDNLPKHAILVYGNRFLEGLCILRFLCDYSKFSQTRPESTFVDFIKQNSASLYTSIIINALLLYWKCSHHIESQTDYARWLADVFNFQDKGSTPRHADPSVYFDCRQALFNYHNVDPNRQCKEGDNIINIILFQ